jgi:hypothetical protein
MPPGHLTVDADVQVNANSFVEMAVEYETEGIASSMLAAAGVEDELVRVAADKVRPFLAATFRRVWPRAENVTLPAGVSYARTMCLYACTWVSDDQQQSCHDWV